MQWAFHDRYGSNLRKPHVAQTFSSLPPKADLDLRVNEYTPWFSGATNPFRSGSVWGEPNPTTTT